MSDETSTMRQMRALVDALREGELTSEQWSHLERLLLKDAAARAYYVQAMLQHASLRWYLKTAAPQRRPTTGDISSVAALDLLARIAEFERSLAVAMPARAPHADEHYGSGRGGLRRALSKWRIAAVLMVAVGMLGLIALWRAIGPSSPVATVAVLTESHDATWRNADDRAIAMHDGDALQPGPLRLTAGLAKVTFSSGAVVVLDARQTNVEMDLRSEKSAQLTLGRITARMTTPSASGFTIDADGYRVVDVGTEFGMMIDDRGAAHVVVIEGVVEATRLDSRGREMSTQRLMKDDAVRLARDQEPVAIDRVAMGAFVTKENFDKTLATIEPPDAPTDSRYIAVRSYSYPDVHEQSQPWKDYGDGAHYKLIDGLLGEKSYNDPAWVGWIDGPVKSLGRDSGRVQPRIEFDLGEPRTIAGLEIVYLVAPKGAVFAPDRVEMTFSDDAQFSSSVRQITSRDFDTTGSANRVYTARISIPPTRAKNVRLDFYNDRQWTFLCEVRFLAAADSTPVP